MSDLFRPLFNPLSEMTGWVTLCSFLVLVVGVSFLFAGKEAGRFYLGFLRALWQVIAAPFVFVRRYTVLSQNSGIGGDYALLASRAPLSVAALSWMNVMVAFSGILMLAAALLLSGKAALPDPEIRGLLAFYEQVRPLTLEELENSKQLQTLLLQGQNLDQLGRNRLYFQIKERRIAFFTAQGEKIEKLFGSNTDAIRAWGELKSGKVDSITRARSEWQLDNVSFRDELHRNKSLDPLFRRLVELRASLEVRIARNRLIQPSESPWEYASQYYGEQNRWRDASNNAEGNLSRMGEETKRLEPLSGLHWKASLLAFATGLAAFVAWIWLYGLLVELANLLLGHLESARKIRDLLEHGSGSSLMQNAGAVASPTSQPVRRVPPVVSAMSPPPAGSMSSEEPALLCITCGSPLDVGAGFCGNCGSKN